MSGSVTDAVSPSVPSPARVSMSVITVVRNDLPGLQRTYVSLLAQGHQAWAWEVVDGLSADGTQAWLAGLDDVRVRWTSAADAGIYDAMNAGMARAHGDLVTFLNAGDRLSGPEAMSAVVASFREIGWRWAYGALALLAADDRRVGELRFDPFDGRALRWGRRSVPHPASWFSLELLRSVGDYDLRYPIAADQEFLMRAAALAPPAVIPVVLVDFSLGGASSHTAPDHLIWEARRMRRQRDGALRWTDLAITCLFALERRARLRAQKLRRLRRPA